jgi:serine/threonine protein phosphatase PrpC
MNLVIQAAGLTDIGLVRANNEDNFGFDVRHGIFVLCDGMGGAAAGELASKIAVNTVLAYFVHNKTYGSPPVVGRSFDGVSVRAAELANAIQLANRAIHDSGAESEERAGMGSTIVAVRVDGNYFSFANVGDSRIYLFRQNGIRQLTNDHSWAMEQVRRGLVTLEEAEHSKLQNVIVRALGSEDSVEPDLEDREFTPGDTLLLCSDGMSRFVKESSMVEVLSHASTLEEACEQLIAAAKQGGSDDNITCLLLRALEQSWQERLRNRLIPGKGTAPQQRSTSKPYAERTSHPLTSRWQLAAQS